MTRESVQPADDWERLWDARLSALEDVFGPSDDTVFHSPLPFYLDGGADVLVFHQSVEGVAYVTADLIGDDRSKASELGQYELAICLHSDASWAPQLLSNLAKYTIDAVLSPGDTMDIAPALPQPTTLSAFVFLRYAEVTVVDNRAGVLLCLGVTADELEFAHQQGSDALVERLKSAGVFPFTDVSRSSVLR